MTPKNVLLLGVGNARYKRLLPDARGFYNAPPSEIANDTIHTLDLDDSVKPDYHHDLEHLPWPLLKHYYDEIHAYEVLEHFGQQGDFRAFFKHFAELWRALKIGGLLYASVPVGNIWTWGDPGHTRHINAGTLVFLQRKEYERQIGKTAMTDYRDYLIGNWELVALNETDDGMRFVLRAI